MLLICFGQKSKPTIVGNTPLKFLQATLRIIILGTQIIKKTAFVMGIQAIVISLTERNQISRIGDPAFLPGPNVMNVQLKVQGVIPRPQILHRYRSRLRTCILIFDVGLAESGLSEKTWGNEAFNAAMNRTLSTKQVVKNSPT
jgi:hypothetical protein